MLYQLSYFRITIDLSRQICASAIFSLCFLVGRDGFEPPKVKTSRFTVCPIWPLWYLPEWIGNEFRADGGIRTPDQLITNQLLWPTELHRHMTLIGLQRYKHFFNLQIFRKLFSKKFRKHSIKEPPPPSEIDFDGKSTANIQLFYETRNTLTIFFQFSHFFFSFSPIYKVYTYI